MLYDRWLHIAKAYRNEMALRDLVAERSWTFAELRAEAERAPHSTGPLAFPQGTQAGFVLAVLRAWRYGQTVCPLELGQKPPTLDALPAGCVHLKTTSATTRAPRCVAFTAEQLAADAEQIVATMGLRPEWPNLGAISLAHSYGFSNLITPLLLHGIPLILAGSALPERVRLAAATAPAVTLPGVPALWRAWHEVGAIPAQTQLAISAGAPLSLVLEQEIYRQTGIKIHNFYGASECGGIAYDPSSEPRDEAACVGTAMHKVALSQNPEGCLEVRSRAVGQTYWPRPDAALAHGCFRTSDLVVFQADRIHLQGRLSEQINVAGRKVSPEVIERVLLRHPQVRECLVFGAPARESVRTEIIIAAVAGNHGLSVEELRGFLLRQLPAWQVPRDWLWVSELAANARGKLSRADWRERYLAASGAGR